MEISRKTNDSVFLSRKYWTSAAWFPCWNKRDTTTVGWRANNCLLHWCPLKRGCFPKPSEALGNFCRGCDVMHKEEKMWVKGRFNHVFSSCFVRFMWWERMRRPMFLPQLFYLHTLWPWQAILLKMFPHLWNENDTCIKGQLWRTDDLS